MPFILAMFTFASHASVLFDGLYYDLDEENRIATVTFKGYYKENSSYVTGNLVIPEQITYEENTYKVSQIGTHAFQHCESLESVFIPGSVVGISWGAFDECRSLAKVEIGYGEDPLIFSDNDSFRYAPIEQVIIGKNLKATDKRYWPFIDIQTINKVYFGDNVTEIPDYAFAYCRSLEDVHFSESIISIGVNAFADTLIDEINLPNVRTIGGGAFSGCNNITRISPDNIPIVEDLGIEAFEGCKNLKEVILPESICKLPYSCFNNCESLSTVILPDNIKEIESNAFKGTLIHEITIPAGVEKLGEYCFGKNPNLTTVYYNAIDATCIDPFWTCNNIETVKFGNLVETIPNSFSGKKIKEIIIPENVKSIGQYAFAANNDLNTVEFLASYCISAYQPFYGCPVTELKIGERITEIPAYCFGEITGPETLEFPESVVSINKQAFTNAVGIKNLTINEGIETIGDHAFAGCNKIETLNFNAVKCTSMGNDGCPVFLYAPLSNIIIGSKVTRIPSNAFADCNRIKEITSMAIEPPLCSSSAFTDETKWDASLRVPIESLGKYKEANVWKDFFNVEAGVSDLNLNENEIEKYYDLEGRQINPDDATNGIYLKMKGQKVKKIIKL